MLDRVKLIAGGQSLDRVKAPAHGGGPGETGEHTEGRRRGTGMNRTVIESQPFLGPVGTVEALPQAAR